MKNTIMFLLMVLLFSCGEKGENIVSIVKKDSSEINQTVHDSVSDTLINDSLVLDGNDTPKVVIDTTVLEDTGVASDTLDFIDTTSSDTIAKADIISVLTDTIDVEVNAGYVTIDNISFEFVDSSQMSLRDSVIMDESLVDYSTVGVYKLILSVLNSAGEIDKEIVYVNVFENNFDNIIVKSLRAQGTNPEIALYIENPDTIRNYTYKGFKLRVYLGYSEGTFSHTKKYMYCDLVELTAWDKPKGYGASNLVTEYSAAGRTREFAYKSDENGNCYVEIDVPSTDEVLSGDSTFQYSTNLEPGTWMMFRMGFYAINYDDEELTGGWSVRSHTVPCRTDSMAVKEGVEVFWNRDMEKFSNEYYVGVYYTDSTGVERKIYGYTP